MPLIKIEDIAPGLKLGLWQMTDSIEELPRPLSPDALANIHTETRLREELSVFNLLRALTGIDNPVVSHNEMGKPLLDGLNVSISHTRGWAAAIVSSEVNVGVDIEYFAERVNKVADRFIRKDELNDTLEQRLINWSAKEAIYKLFSDEDLQYFEMRLQPFLVGERGSVVVDDLKNPKKAKVDFILNKDFVLTWCIAE